MEPFDLEPFVAFMKSRGLPPERNIPYYASWVRRYLQAEAPGVIADITDKIHFFCEPLTCNETVQDWQIEQARRAIELYERVFRKERLPSSAPEKVRIVVPAATYGNPWESRRSTA